MADVSDAPPNDWFPSDEACQIARCVRGCATDEQYTDLVWQIDRALQARRAAEAKAVEALRKIADLEPAPFDGFPSDWSEQIERCPDCQRYKNHPIQNGICDTHRRPIWARERHDEHEPRRLYYAAQRIAKEALGARDD